MRDSLRDILEGYQLVVVSNREPYIHSWSGGVIKCIVPASGLTAALDPVMRSSGGVWVAHGSGNADWEVVDQADRVAVPPEEPSYQLRRIRLSKELEEDYYYGFSNQTLWPLCHVSYVRPIFEQVQWNAYVEANQLFADAVCQEIGDRPAFVFIQDYHLALVPRLIKQRNPHVVTAHFWHIPWPNPESFRICPWQDEILDGLLGNDLLGFQIWYHCTNFLDTIDRTMEARIDRERSEVIRRGSRTIIRPYPISVDFEDIDQQAQSHLVTEEMGVLRRELGLEGQLVGMGLDRIDYTKGIPERLRAFQKFLERYPSYRGKVTFVQVGAPSRLNIGAYKQILDEVESLVEEINWELGYGRWKPVIHLPVDLSPTQLLALRRIANFAVVSSLHDGMNLVAKEYVASRFDEDGVLVLSPFTGAARELTGALLANPYSTDQLADAIKKAVEMKRPERQRRMRDMRKIVKENDIYQWASNILSDLSRLTPDGVTQG